MLSAVPWGCRQDMGDTVEVKQRGQALQATGWRNLVLSCCLLQQTVEPALAGHWLASWCQAAFCWRRL